MPPFSAHSQMLYVEYIGGGSCQPVQLNPLQLLYRNSPSANAAIKEHLDSHVRSCDNLEYQRQKCTFFSEGCLRNTVLTSSTSSQLKPSPV